MKKEKRRAPQSPSFWQKIFVECLRNDSRADRNIAVLSPREREERAVAASEDKIIAVCRSPESDVGFAVLIEIAGRRFIGRAPELRGDGCAGRAAIDPPFADTGAENRDVGTAVTVEIAAHRNIARRAERHDVNRVAAGVENKKGSG